MQQHSDQLKVQHHDRKNEELYDISEHEEEQMRMLLRKLEQDTERSHNTRSKRSKFEWNPALNSKQVVLERKTDQNNMTG